MDVRKFPSGQANGDKGVFARFLGRVIDTAYRAASGTCWMPLFACYPKAKNTAKKCLNTH